MTLCVDFDMRGIPEISKRREQLELAQRHLRSGNFSDARKAADEADRFARLARTRISTRRGEPR
jgi:hypothetical protein